MVKHFAHKDYVVVKDFKNQLLKSAKSKSELTKHNIQLWEGTRLECMVWAKAKNREQEILVETWANLREQRRVPLPSQDITKLDSQIEELTKQLGELVSSSKASISKELGGNNTKEKAVIAPLREPHQQIIQL